MNRRGFLRGLLGVVAAAAVAPSSLLAKFKKTPYTFGGSTITGYTNFPNRITPDDEITKVSVAFDDGTEFIYTIVGKIEFDGSPNNIVRLDSVVVKDTEVILPS
jgi:hypothetical protein